jgi:hypothetical protein
MPKSKSTLATLTDTERERLSREPALVRLRAGGHADTRPGPVSPPKSRPRLADLGQESRARNKEEATSSGWFSVCLLCCTCSLNFARVRSPPSPANQLPGPVRLGRIVEHRGESRIRLREEPARGELSNLIQMIMNPLRIPLKVRFILPCLIQ